MSLSYVCLLVWELQGALEEPVEIQEYVFYVVNSNYGSQEAKALKHYKLEY